MMMRTHFRLARTVTLLGLFLAPAFSLQAVPPIPEECKAGGFAIGTIAYTFEHFTFFEALEKTAQAGAKVVELSAFARLSKEQPEVPFNYQSSPETLAKVKAKLAACHLQPVNFSIMPFPGDEAEARKVFVFAKTMGVRAITTESPEHLDLMEKLVKEYEYNWDNSLPDVAECIGFVRGYGASKR